MAREALQLHGIDVDRGVDEEGGGGSESSASGEESVEAHYGCISF